MRREPRILIVEDESAMSDLIAASLRGVGFGVTAVDVLAEASREIATTGYDAVVLDLSLPDGSGIDFLRRLRNEGHEIPVLVLTVRDGVSDKVHGFEAGADDYLVKPFETFELVARIRALLRRPGGIFGQVIEAGNITMDTSKHELWIGGEAAHFSPRERELLDLLIRNSGQVVSKSQIESRIYESCRDIGYKNLDVIAHRLRKRLIACGAAVKLHTFRGVGYMLTAEREPDDTSSHRNADAAMTEN